MRRKRKSKNLKRALFELFTLVLFVAAFALLFLAGALIEIGDFVGGVLAGMSGCAILFTDALLINALF